MEEEGFLQRKLLLFSVMAVFFASFVFTSVSTLADEGSHLSFFLHCNLRICFVLVWSCFGVWSCGFAFSRWRKRNPLQWKLFL